MRGTLFAFALLAAAQAQLPCSLLEQTLASRCGGSVAGTVYVSPLPSVLSQLHCPSRLCSLVPESVPFVVQQDSGACVVAWNHTWGRACHSNATEASRLAIYPSWGSAESSSSDSINVTVSPGTFAASASSYVLAFDAVILPMRLPTPGIFLEMSTVKVIAFKDSPVKPVKVSIRLDAADRNWSSSGCWLPPTSSASKPSVFYFDQMFNAWISVSAQHEFDASRNVVSTHIDLKTVGEKLGVLFVAVLKGVPGHDWGVRQYVSGTRYTQLSENYAISFSSLDLKWVHCLVPELFKPHSVGILPADAPELQILSQKQGLIPLATGFKVVSHYQYRLDFNVTFALPVTPPEVRESLATASYRDESDERTNITGAFFFPVYLDRSYGRWEQLRPCSFNSTKRSVTCWLNDEWTQGAGSHLSVINAMARDYKSLALFEKSIREKPAPRDGCLHIRDYIGSWCNESVVSVTQGRFGRESVRPDVMQCKQETCILLPASAEEYCLLAFRKKCGTFDKTTQQEACCPELSLMVNERESLLNVYPNWTSWYDNTKHRKKETKMPDLLAYDIQPGTFDSPHSAVVLYDMHYALPDLPSPNQMHTRGRIANLVLQNIPLKAVEVRMHVGAHDAQTDAKCGSDALHNGTTSAVFYYDSPLHTWLSMPPHGDAKAGRSYYEASTESFVAVVPPRLVVRSRLSIFMVVVKDIAVEQSGRHLTSVYSMPPTTLGYGLSTQRVNGECRLPVVAASGKMDALSSQGLVAVGGSSMLSLASVPASLFTIGLFVDPELWRGPDSAGTAAGRSLMQIQQPSSSDVQPYYYSNSSATWIQLPNCSYSNVTSSNECLLSPAFFHENGLYFLVCNAVSNVSNVSRTLSAQALSAARIENMSRDELLREFGIPADETTTTPIPTTPVPTEESVPPLLSTASVAGIAAAAAFLLAALALALQRYKKSAQRMPPVPRARLISSLSQHPSYNRVPALEADIDSFLKGSRRSMA